MASPQIEKGFMRIALELIDALACIDLNQNETKVLLVILRKTYGWKKKKDAISLSQFMAVTHIDKKGVIRSIQSLEQRKIITKTDTGRGRNAVTIYEIQKDYDQWRAHTGENYQMGNGGIHATNNSEVNGVTDATNKPVDKSVDKPVDNFFNGGIEAPLMVASPLDLMVASTPPTKDNTKDNTKGGLFFGGVVENLKAEAQGLKKMGYDKDWIKSHFLTREIPESQIDKALGKEF